MARCTAVTKGWSGTSSSHASGASANNRQNVSAFGDSKRNFCTSAALLLRTSALNSALQFILCDAVASFNAEYLTLHRTRLPKLYFYNAHAHGGHTRAAGATSLCSVARLGDCRAETRGDTAYIE